MFANITAAPSAATNLEQPQLGGEISRDVGMIVQVIARQIGEAAGAHPHPIEPTLIEPMRRRFDREMRDAFARRARRARDAAPSDRAS